MSDRHRRPRSSSPRSAHRPPATEPAAGSEAPAPAADGAGGSLEEVDDAAVAGGGRRPSRSSRSGSSRSSSSRSPSSSGRPSRSESKELTHRALQRAALKLLSHRSFDAISLREVTREAGISPTAFYRHYGDMEELGLELVDESFTSLRELLRAARADPSVAEDAVRGSIDVLVHHVDRYEGHMRFIARERYGGVSKLRKAIKRELQLFADELAIDLAGFPGVDRWDVDDRRMLAELIVERMVALAGALLDAGPDEARRLTERTVRQMRLVFLAVPHWRPSR